MKLLLLLASLLIIAIPHAHARILQGTVNSVGNKLDMIISVYGRGQRSPPPPPSSSPSKHHSTRGNDTACDHDTAKLCQRSADYRIRSPPPPPPIIMPPAESVSSKEHHKASAGIPPPPPKRSPPIGMSRTNPPAALCMPGRPCTTGFIMSS